MRPSELLKIKRDDACADITEFVAQGRADAEKSKLVLTGVVRQLLVIGEAVERIGRGHQIPCPERALEADRRHARPIGARLLRHHS